MAPTEFSLVVVDWFRVLAGDGFRLVVVVGFYDRAPLIACQPRWWPCWNAHQAVAASSEVIRIRL